MRGLAAALLLFWALPGWAGYRVTQVAPVPLGALEGTGQVADPRVSPGATHLGFEFLGASGDTLEVYTALLTWQKGGGVVAVPEPVLPEPKADPFALGGPARRAVSESLAWGPPKRGRPRFAVAATRKAAHRGGSQVNFDLHLSEPGRRRFLTEHPDTDAQPRFSPDGEFVAFSSGRTGQGDIYLYHFFAEGEPLIRLTFEGGGSELYPTWSADGQRLAYISHLGSEDHVVLLDGVPDLVASGARRQAAVRRASRDLTKGWRVSCLAPSFSPDGNWVAFYAREGQGGRADLYVVPAQGGAVRRLLEGGLPETRGGPRWAPDSSGLFAVREDAEQLNPLLWVPLAEGAPPSALTTGTELNADPWPVQHKGRLFLLFTAQGADERNEKRWRRVYLAGLKDEENP